VINLFPGER